MEHLKKRLLLREKQEGSRDLGQKLGPALPHLGLFMLCGCRVLSFWVDSLERFAFFPVDFPKDLTLVPGVLLTLGKVRDINAHG